MNDPLIQPPQAARPVSRVPTTVVYALYLGALLLPFLTIAGVIISYIYRNDGPEWLQTHHQFQIRTFWIGLLITVLASLTFIIGLGWILAVVWLVWFLVRVINGLLKLQRSEAVTKPESWLFG